MTTARMISLPILASLTIGVSGEIRGKITLKKSGAGYKGKRISRGPLSSIRTTVVKLARHGGGTSLGGVLRDSLSGGDDGRCRDKRRFSAELDQTEAFVPERDTGHYVGQSQAGLPVSFDLLAQPGQSRIENLSVDVQADLELASFAPSAA